ncbi:hypothetical protein [Pseudodesulfovibrio sp.]|uniref:hypothetical protein n=1 Tax=unclassified Pseudodesulfovibrio TaxID=2661612 RepID=UPI003B002FCF
MKKRSKALWNDLFVSLLMGLVGGGLVHWYAGMWELTMSVGLFLFASGMRGFSWTFFCGRFDDEDKTNGPA